MPSRRCCLRKRGAAHAAPFSCPRGMKKGPPERTVLDGTGCGGAVPSSRGQEGKPAACCRPEKHGRSIARWPGKAMPRPRTVQFDTQSRRARRDADGRAPAPEGQEAFRWCACGRQGPGRLPPPGACSSSRSPAASALPGRRPWLYGGAPVWDAAAALLRARQAAVTLAIFSPWKILWENVPCAMCWPREPPCVRGSAGRPSAVRGNAGIGTSPDGTGAEPGRMPGCPLKKEKAGSRKGNLPFKYWWAHQDSNLGPAGYEPEALPTEL